MSLIIAYLGVSKVNLAYERYMSAQIATGHAFMILRELNQLSITLTEQYANVEADEWRRGTKRAIVQLIQETVATLRNERHAAVLARHADNCSRIGVATLDKHADTSGFEDPMVLVHALRSHLYHNSTDLCRSDRDEDDQTHLQLLERCKLMDLLHEFMISYRDLLRLASSSLPFALVQMGRTFIFIWTLTIPLVLVGEDFFEKYFSAFFFVILLTYGFLGLEFVSRMLSNPFGGQLDDEFNIRGMGSSAIVGIEEDSKLAGFHTNRKAEDRNDIRVDVTRSTQILTKFVQKREDSFRMSNGHIALDQSKDTMDGSDMNSSPYRTMEEGRSQSAHSAFL